VQVFITKVTKNKSSEDSYPFAVPTIKNLESLEFSTPITFLVGENGSGKSSFLESLATASECHTIGATDASLDKSLEGAKKLAKSLKLSWNIKTHRGFFVRSEDVFGFTKSIIAKQIYLQKEASFFEKTLSGYGRQLAVGAMLGQQGANTRRYGDNLDANSHGETFLKIFNSRFVPEGLYILDEPETPLSFQNQLVFISMLRKMVTQNSQFIIATHSPILAAMPEASVYSFDDNKIHKIKYEEIKSFSLIKDFLNHPEAFLRQL
jgi:predicted ATPase